MKLNSSGLNHRIICSVSHSSPVFAKFVFTSHSGHAAHWRNFTLNCHRLTYRTMINLNVSVQSTHSSVNNWFDQTMSMLICVCAWKTITLQNGLRWRDGVISVTSSSVVVSAWTSSRDKNRIGHYSGSKRAITLLYIETSFH